jgi:hypothetical protein
LWTDGVWRCEYWSRRDDGGELRLYFHNDLQRSHEIHGWKAADKISAQWRALIARDDRQPSDMNPNANADEVS